MAQGKFGDSHATRIINALDERSAKRTKSGASVAYTWGTVGAIDAGNKIASAYLYGETNGAYMSTGFRIPETMYLTIGDVVRVALNYQTGDRWIEEKRVSSAYKRIAHDLATGSAYFGPGTSSPDVRLRRSSTKRMTLDDGAGGAADLEVSGNLDVTGGAYITGNEEVTGNLDVTGTLKKGGTAVSLDGHTHAGGATVVLNPVKYATAATLPANTQVGSTLEADVAAAITVDSATPSVNDRVLVKNQATTSKHGIYKVTTVGAAADAGIAEVTSQRNTAGAGAATTLTFTYPGTPTNGNLMVAVLSWRGDATISGTPSGWNLARNMSGTDIDGAIYYKVAGAAESTTAQFTLSASVKSAGAASEFSNGTGWPSGTGALDKVNSNSGSGTAGTTGLTGTLTQANELVITAFANIDTFTWGSHDNSQTEFGEAASTGGGTNTRNNTSAGRRIVSATTTTNYGATLSSSGTWIAAVATFMPNAISAGTKWVLTRDTDDFAASPVEGTVIPVNSGTVNADSLWMLTATPTLTMTRMTLTAVPDSGIMPTPVYPGTELAYVEKTTNVTVTATTEGTAQEIVSAGPVTFDGTTRVCIEWFAPSFRPENTGSVNVNITVILKDGSTVIGYISGAASGAAYLTTPTGGKRYITPTAASHTYSVAAFVGSGSGVVYAAAGGSDSVPGFIRITKA